MIEYITPKHSSALLKVDVINCEAEAIDCTYDNIDTMYIVPENGEFEGKPVVKGDFIILMYGNKAEGRDAFIFHNDELYEYYMKLEQDRKKRDAERNAYCEECCCKEV